MYTLIEALPRINYDRNVGVWAKPINDQLLPESPARIDDVTNESGEILEDGFVFVGNGEWIGYTLGEWTNWDEETGEGELVEGWFEDLIDPINEDKPWEPVEECKVACWSLSSFTGCGI
jgi:hypothetical protein